MIWKRVFAWLVVAPMLLATVVLIAYLMWPLVLLVFIVIVGSWLFRRGGELEAA